MARHILVTVIDGEIEVDGFDSHAEARHALMREIYEIGQDTDDLPDNDTDEAIASWINENNLRFVWRIQEIPE